MLKTYGQREITHKQEGFYFTKTVSRSMSKKKKKDKWYFTERDKNWCMATVIDVVANENGRARV